MSKSGLSQLIFILVAFAIIISVGWLSWEAHHASGEMSFDHSIKRYLFAIKSPALEKFFRMAGRLGSSAVIMSIASAVGIFLISNGRWRMLMALCGAVMCTTATIHIAKWLIYRPRPSALTDIAASSSFPSAHAASTMVVWGIVGYVIGSNISGSPRCASLLVIGIIIASVGISLIMRNAHYPSDVAAGLLVGTFWLSLGIRFSVQ